MKEIRISYDKRADVMYVMFGGGRKAEAEEVRKNVFVRFEPNSKEIVGVTIVNFSNFLQKKPELKLVSPVSG